MASWTADRVAKECLDVMNGTLVHQRGRCGPLLGHGAHAHEGWWKAEFALALESWCWRHDLPIDFGVYTEAKPRDWGLGNTQLSADLLVAPFVNPEERITAGPRVWIELKERGWWWGGAGKALGTGNGGLHHDLEKWKTAVEWTPQDVLLVCQVSINDGRGDAPEALPPGWRDAIKGLPGFLAGQEASVGYPVAEGLSYNTKEPKADVRWLTLSTFQVHPAL